MGASALDEGPRCEQLGTVFRVHENSINNFREVGYV